MHRFGRRDMNRVDADDGIETDGDRFNGYRVSGHGASEHGTDGRINGHIAPGGIDEHCGLGVHWDGLMSCLNQRDTDRVSVHVNRARIDG